MGAKREQSCQTVVGELLFHILMNKKDTVNDMVDHIIDTFVYRLDDDDENTL